jgi:hypothetical protein
MVQYITFFATFALNCFSAALTGSFVWEASDRLISSSVRLTGIGRGVKDLRNLLPLSARNEMGGARLGGGLDFPIPRFRFVFSLYLCVPELGSLVFDQIQG